MRVFLWFVTVGLAFGESNRVQVEEAWAIFFSGGSAEVYMVLYNPTSQPLSITGVESPSFEETGFKRWVQDSGDHLPLAQRYHLEKVDHLELAANSSLSLKPDGLRITLSGLKPGRSTGDGIRITLFLGDGQTLTIDATLRK